MHCMAASLEECAPLLVVSVVVVESSPCVSHPPREMAEMDRPERPRKRYCIFGCGILAIGGLGSVTVDMAINIDSEEV